ncbi:hypothetical protein OESDEN_11161 [Oesophagostomum dentatum]|uniref:Saposin B-type domain-containing protein n=1 Tax=Oesophagostomum dentatum TaxID=61180 RepID=A0A0B1SYP3_OESDE|nr:hypothetical protein OESDEN_11161 [Oesophagostomum dentatum]
MNFSSVAALFLALSLAVLVTSELDNEWHTEPGRTRPSCYELCRRFMITYRWSLEANMPLQLFLKTCNVPYEARKRCASDLCQKIETFAHLTDDMWGAAKRHKVRERLCREYSANSKD